MIRLKWHESWLHDSFLSLDPELIEKNHGTAQKNMHRCVRAFEKLENEGWLRDIEVAEPAEPTFTDPA